jgi:hypothetical protein
MCGDLDEDESDSELEARLYARFRLNARALLKGNDQPSADQPADLAGYMEKLFCDVLSRAVRDGEQSGEGRHYERLAMQPIVFARLAGLLAGHLALGEDPLRKVIEALMLGYGEAQTMDQARDHGHHHGDVVVHGQH